MPTRTLGILTSIGLWIGAALCLLPMIWMVISSLRPRAVPPNQIFTGFDQLTLENYQNVFDRLPVLQLLGNTVLICVLTLVLQVGIGVPAAYALSRLRFRGNRVVFWLVMATLMVPTQVTLLPIYIAFANMGLINTYAALILPFGVSAFGLFLFYQFFRGLPQSLLDAGRVDGLSEWSIAWTIVFPLARPAVIAFAIFSVVGRWNEFFWPLMMTQGLDIAPITLGISYFADAESGRDYGGQMALSTLSVLPLLIAFFFAQRRFVEGIALTGLKG
jgi:multiple sugar transport system permease protein